jgi:hypothetical protein
VLSLKPPRPPPSCTQGSPPRVRHPQATIRCDERPQRPLRRRFFCRGRLPMDSHVLPPSGPASTLMSSPPLPLSYLNRDPMATTTGCRFSSMFPTGMSQASVEFPIHRICPSHRHRPLTAVVPLGIWSPPLPPVAWRAPILCFAHGLAAQLHMGQPKGGPLEQFSLWFSYRIV